MHKTTDNLDHILDFPAIQIERGDKVIEYTFLINVQTNNNPATILIPQTTLTDVYDWFCKKLNRPANGNEIFIVARQLYVTGRYAEALACTMLFRGDLKEIRVHGGGVDNLHCLHLQGHVCWKLGYNKQSLNCLQEVIEKRNNNTLSKSVRGLNGSSNSNGSEPVGPTSFEDSWQLLVEMGLEVIEGGIKQNENEKEDVKDAAGRDESSKYIDREHLNTGN